MDCLPPELIKEIFRRGSQSDFDDGSNAIPTTVIQCLAVCQRWRDIALDTPDVFCEVCVPSKYLRQEGYDYARWASFWLTRSKTCSFSFKILLHWGDEQELSAVCALTRECLIPHVDRLRVLHLINGGVCHSLLHPVLHLFHPLYQETRVHAPALEELVVRRLRPPPDYSESESSFPFLFESTPKLRTLIIHGTYCLSQMVNLTYFEVYGRIVDERFLRSLARDCPRLQTLALRSLRLAIPDHRHTGDITIESLQTLIVGFAQQTLQGEAVDAKHPLTRLCAPNLKCLEIISRDLTIGLSSVLPKPSVLTSLRSLKLDGVAKTVQNRRVNRTFDNSYWFLDLPSDSVEEIHLTDADGEVLGIELPVYRSNGRTQKDDIGVLSSRQPNGLPTQSRDIYLLVSPERYAPVSLFDATGVFSSAFSFKNVKSMTISSFKAEDMMWLCRVLTVRPNIRTLTLSQSALMTLKASLALTGGQDGLWSISVRKPGFTSYRLDHNEDKGISVEEWIKERADVRVLRFEKRP